MKKIYFIVAIAVLLWFCNYFNRDVLGVDIEDIGGQLIALIEFLLVCLGVSFYFKF